METRCHPHRKSRIRPYAVGLVSAALIHAAKIQQQRELLEGQLAGLQIYASNKAAAAVRTVMRVPKTGKRRKPAPKYQSKRDKRLKWTGGGMLPVWMREEMKGTKLNKENFLIK